MANTTTAPTPGRQKRRHNCEVDEENTDVNKQDNKNDIENDTHDCACLLYTSDAADE